MLVGLIFVHAFFGGTKTTLGPVHTARALSTMRSSNFSAPSLLVIKGGFPGPSVLAILPSYGYPTVVPSGYIDASVASPSYERLLSTGYVTVYRLSANFFYVTLIMTWWHAFASPFILSAFLIAA